MWARAFAGIFAGFFLAAAATGLVTWLPPGPWQNALVPALIAFVPLWMLAALWAFSFRRAGYAWLALAGSAVAGFGVLGLLRMAGAVQ
ncbi:PEX28-32 family peroxisomal membrane protein [Stenotrophomonas sp. GD03930]|uniref:hypothetical protein n=1 Tax=Stenotrophomonas sp. GD03930 TaxID=2975406 RepID=UPI002449BDDB|nr:hypothetical protein [Stenotrophomonas sp. GD03930]MDH1234260.1 PEX28-32 family peroxisomal membrane protein [Stenotrophomonas sp. GD03930]HEL4298157.1 hypothetical protein [Stenotrophomonas maltophilia]